MMSNNTFLIIRTIVPSGVMIVIAILTFITSGFMIFLLSLRGYVIFTTYAIEHVTNSIQLVLSNN